MRPRFGKKSSDEKEESYCAIDRELCTISIVGDITTDVASKFRRYIRSLEKSTKRRPITVEINSEGGDIYAGWAIVDSIELCKRRVITRVAGAAMSMGVIIALAGDRIQALEHSIIMIHQASYEFDGTHTLMNSEFKENLRLQAQLWAYLDEKTGNLPGYWEKICNRTDFYLTPEEAVKFGVIHEVLK